MPDETDFLGAIATDMITGFSGICTGVAYSISAPPHFEITPRHTGAGPLVESQWFYRSRVEFGDPAAQRGETDEL